MSLIRYICSTGQFSSPALANPALAPNSMFSSSAFYANTSVSGAQQPAIQVQSNYVMPRPSTESPTPSFSVPSLIGVSVDPLAEALYFDVPSVTTFMALHNNARVLGLSSPAARPLPRKWPASSRLASSPPIPSALQPVPLQTTVDHMPYIDCIPFPIVRQNLLALQGIIDEDRFGWDLVGSKSNYVMNGAASWDPRAWSFGPDFMEKWGFLFCQTLGS